jgi:hypothetical protein
MHTHRMHAVAAIGFAAALTLTAAARAESPAPAPTPAPEIQKFLAIAGTFEGDASYTPADGQPMRFTLHHTNRVISGGFGLGCHEESDSPEMGHYEAENLFGWDAGGRKLHMFSVTTEPNTHDHAGTWISPTKGRFRYEGIKDGKTYVEEIPFELVSANEYRFTATTRVAGKVTGVYQATMKRVENMSSR